MAFIQTIFNFHSIGPLERQAEENEMLYNVSADQFSRWVDLIAPLSNICALTFDDGNKSDVEIALPILQKFGLKALFFPIINRIGTKGYVTWEDLETLIKAGMQIGSHGLNHIAWAECSESHLQEELRRSRSLLEQHLKTPITHAAAPFGAISPRVHHAAQKAGYTHLYSSSNQSYFVGATLVPRFSVTSQMSPANTINWHTNRTNRFKTSLRSLAQNIRYKLSSS